MSSMLCSSFTYLRTSSLHLYWVWLYFRNTQLLNTCNLRFSHEVKIRFHMKMKQMRRESSSNEWHAVFQKEPPLPPSPAQAALRREVPMSEKRVDRHTYLQTLKLLFTNRNFALLLVSYGINVGVFYVVSTLLNQIVLLHFAVSSAKIAQIIIRKAVMKWRRGIQNGQK